ncbi:MAG: DUF3696 domain-containing protein [Nitrospirae bacterium]|nr:DUF3696 domain-containing protein [Nitrospirota bacterium]
MEATKIPVKSLNLLTGVNGSGKSSVLQSILLYNQSFVHKLVPFASRKHLKLMLNGYNVQMGNFKDLRNSHLPEEYDIENTFVFTEQNGNNTITLHFYLNNASFNDDEAFANIPKYDIKGILNSEEFEETEFKGHLSSKKRGFKGNIFFHPFDADHMSARVNDVHIDLRKFINYHKIHYVSAERIGPREFYQKSGFFDFPNVGSKGEFTTNVLVKKKYEPIDDRLCLPTQVSKTLADQTEAWMDNIFRGCKLDVNEFENTIIFMKLNSNGSGNLYRPTNVGFGYTYALPIFVSGLIAQKDEMLIVENPEAHLHPSAQTQIAYFLSLVSSCGVQVLIESHSDHVLNGLLIAVKDGIVKSDDLNILYFGKEKEHVNMKEIEVHDNGKIEDWPDGFFDQTEKDFARLYGK